MRHAILFLSLLASPAIAADYTVNPGDSIQVAIDSAVDGDRVLIEPGTYVERIDFSGKAIELLGVQGALLTTIDGGGSGPTVLFINGEGLTSRLVGVTITGGSGSIVGGGIYCTGSTPTIEDCVIRNNIGKTGGGFHGNGVLRRCTIRNNNSSQGFGGGIWGAPTIENCIVLENTVTGGSGGGLFLTDGTATISGTRFEGNRAILGQGRGGGIHVNSTANATIEHCLLFDNYTTAGVFAAYGGAIFIEASGSSITHCTIVDNSLAGSSEDGGGIYSLGSVSVKNSIVRNNVGTQIGGTALVSYSDIQGGLVGVGNIDLDPQFVAPLSDDFHLLPSSPCIDAGDPADPLDADGSVVDMGAFPFDSSTLFADRCNGDGGDRLGCTDCPCGNDAPSTPGGTIGGCLNSAGTSAKLFASGDTSVSLPPAISTDLRFSLVGAPSAAFCILNSGDALAPTNAANPCFGLGSGVQSSTLDGLRCAVMNTRRHGGRSADANGDVGVTNDPWGGEGGPAAGLVGAGDGFVAGQTRYFQVIHRDDPLAVCTRGLNTSQAIQVTFTP